MIVVITMAGQGKRFRDAGYDCPKYMIKARGKTLFEWSMDSLVGYNPYVSKYVFVTRQEDKADSFIREHCRGFSIPDVEIIELDHQTDGQATTAMVALERCQNDESVLIYNIDTYVEPFAMQHRDLTGDGHIPCFKALGDHWSFVKTDEGGLVREVREKQRISNNCSVGAYYFLSVDLYRTIYKEFYGQQENVAIKEKYIAPMYNYMIQKGYEVTMSLIDKDKVHVLGTPEELEEFKILGTVRQYFTVER